MPIPISPARYCNRKALNTAAAEKQFGNRPIGKPIEARLHGLIITTEQGSEATAAPAPIASLIGYAHIPTMMPASGASWQSDRPHPHPWHVAQRRLISVSLIYLNILIRHHNADENFLGESILEALEASNARMEQIVAVMGMPLGLPAANEEDICA